jgi:transcription elongation factor GreB
MSKAFTSEEAAESDDGDIVEASPLPAGARNYMTPGGFARMRRELDMLVSKERPELVATVAWAAGNGDRSENGDYIYGKKRLREIDRRLRFLTKRLDTATIVTPAEQTERERIYFGATVTLEDEDGARTTYQIVGSDEIDAAGGRISVESPIGRALLRKAVGDSVEVRRPRGEIELTVVDIRYE